MVIEPTERAGAAEADPSGRYTELDHPADLFLEVRSQDLCGLFENSLYALYDHLVVLADFEEREQVTLESKGPTVAETLRALLSEALFEFSAQGFVAVRAEVELHDRPDGGAHAAARLHGERVDRARHTLLTEIKAITYHQLSVEPAGENGWRATVLLDV